MPDEATIVKKLLDLLKTPSTNIDLAAKTENPRQMIVKILLAMKDLGYVLTERSGAERHYKLKVPRQDIPDNVDKLVKIARLVRGNLDMAQERSRDVKNISEEIIGEKPEAVMAAIKVICLMAENKAVTFTSKDEADIKNLELEKDKAIAITEGKYPELRIKLN